MMTVISKLAKSRTVWTLLAIFAFNGLQGVAAAPSFSQVNPKYVTDVNAILTLLGMYFRYKGAAL
jgi:hypothetical protein